MICRIPASKRVLYLAYGIGLGLGQVISVSVISVSVVSVSFSHIGHIGHIIIGHIGHLSHIGIGHIGIGHIGIGHIGHVGADTTRLKEKMNETECVNNDMEFNIKEAIEREVMFQ
jgi:hypothetical protein